MESRSLRLLGMAALCLALAPITAHPRGDHDTAGRPLVSDPKTAASGLLDARKKLLAALDEVEQWNELEHASLFEKYGRYIDRNKWKTASDTKPLVEEGLRREFLVMANESEKQLGEKSRRRKSYSDGR